MSGHSKWHSIKHKKGAADAKRGKIFTKHAKLIFIAARDGGADPEMNPGLRTAIVNAKSDNVPNANIDKALKKASGDKNQDQLHEIMYEGFGPEGTAFFVQVITDNKNRSVAAVKTAFTKNGGNMGAAGSVGWMFDCKGVIMARFEGRAPDESELAAIDAGAEDLSFDDDLLEIITDPSELMSVKDKLENTGFEIEKAVLSYLAKDPVNIDSVDIAKRAIKLMDALEDDDDVSGVYANFDIADEIMDSL